MGERARGDVLHRPSEILGDTPLLLHDLPRGPLARPARPTLQQALPVMNGRRRQAGQPLHVAIRPLGGQKCAVDPPQRFNGDKQGRRTHREREQLGHYAVCVMAGRARGPGHSARLSLGCVEVMLSHQEKPSSHVRKLAPAPPMIQVGLWRRAMCPSRFARHGRCALRKPALAPRRNVWSACKSYRYSWTFSSLEKSLAIAVSRGTAT